MPTIRALLVPADEDTEVSVVEFDQGDIRAIQQYVGGNFDVVDGTDPAVSLWHHDEGKLIGLPMNRRTTMFLWMAASNWRHQDVLMGDVLITGQADQSGETTGISEELLKLITEVHEYKYQVQVIGSDTWSGNGRTFTSYWEALNGGLALLDRWKLGREVRILAV